MKFLTKTMHRFFSKLFHTRSIIIISTHRTNHLSISGSLQVLALLGFVGCVGWASYSTGSYMAARNVLEQRDATIKSVASSRVDTNFSYLSGNSPLVLRKAPLQQDAQAVASLLTDPSYALAGVNHDKLYARIAVLENKVKELRTTNSEIVTTVREKTRDKILNMESIIRSTGLNLDTLKQEAMRNRKAARSSNASNTADGGQGGPFIPAESLEAAALSKELDTKLEHLMMLNDIITSLPLGKPVANYTPQSGFGRRVDPINGRLAFHAGVDLAAAINAPVRATAPGKIIAAGWDGAYGNAVDIDHGMGVVTRYGHLSSIAVKAGQTVKKDQLIGAQGSTGRSTGPHVHYEVRYNDKPINPINFLNAGNHVSEIN